VTALFQPNGALTLTASNDAAPGTANFTITGTADGITHSTAATVAVTQVLTGTMPVDLTGDFNVTGIYTDGSKFSEAGGMDGGGYALSQKALGSDPVGDGVIFHLGPANAPDAVTGKTVALPHGNFSSIKLLALAVEGRQTMQPFLVTYDDGTTASFTQSLSDWAEPGRQVRGQSVAVEMPYRLAADGSVDGNPFYAYAYSFPLDSGKVVRSISLPASRNVAVLAMTLVPAKE
ncbi:MAG: S53 family peptidase, partial [Acidobacteriaceae bacterium]